MAKEDWKEIDPQAELTQEQQRLYIEMKTQYRLYAEHKAAFEQAMQASVAGSLPTGMELKFGYMFGKLSVAIGPANAKRAKAQTEVKPTLGEWLAAQAKEGRSC